jgi:hypothetical protein
MVKNFPAKNTPISFSILVNDPISARRFIHVLVKLGKITKSTQQQQRPPASPSMLPEDREVTDIMTQRKVSFLLIIIIHPHRCLLFQATVNHSSNQPNQWH